MLALDRPLVSWNYLESLTGLSKDYLEALASEAGKHYEPFDLQREGTTKWRHIDNPKGPLREAQRALQSGLFSKVEFPESMVGGVRGRSTIDAARVHVDQPWLVTIDLRNCFPKTNNVVVYKALIKHLGCIPSIAATLTKLVTYHRRVPQGASTSPAVVNLALLDLHSEIAEICREQELQFSVYVDDIAFSGPNARLAIEPIIRAVQRHGYAVGSKKKKILGRGDKQAVTGVVVNRHLSAGRARITELREEIIALSRQPIITSAQLRSIGGKINDVARINAAQGAAVSRLATRLLPPSGVEVRRERRVRYRNCPPCFATGAVVY